MSAPGDSSHNESREGVVFSPFHAVSWLLKIFQAQITRALSGANKFHAATTATEFHRFQELPPEIRRLIWRASLPPARIYEPVQGICAFVDFLSSRPTRFVREWSPPAMRAACREAYGVCMAAGRFRFGYFDGSSVRGVWYNNDLDAVYYASDDNWRHPLGDIRNIYVGADIALDPAQFARFVADCDVSSCSKLVVAVDPRLQSYEATDFEGTEPFFRPMRDDDIVGLRQTPAGSLPDDVNKSTVTWADLKLILQDHLKYQLVMPRLEAVEVFRRRLTRDDKALE
ncbi:hypothetical protein CMUS01_08501 [Colletotrichum musicola]|uniref:2EXR domain-containing protein n=1 Tax=Colletotrichum musicola TaxID=2175873 RepID=A0A8H6KDB2_9PEZI|nr:hypothetical protein CMUS01_08501 [Colletotrichum musicola]